MTTSSQLHSTPTIDHAREFNVICAVLELNTNSKPLSSIASGKRESSRQEAEDWSTSDCQLSLPRHLEVSLPRLVFNKVYVSKGARECEATSDAPALGSVKKPFINLTKTDIRAPPPRHTQTRWLSAADRPTIGDFGSREASSRPSPGSREIKAAPSRVLAAAKEVLPRDELPLRQQHFGTRLHGIQQGTLVSQKKFLVVSTSNIGISTERFAPILTTTATWLG
ncbi:hypothetical protein CaCOL14_004329 [Colletotrichum acutatum]